MKRGAPLGNKNAVGKVGGGRPPNWLKEACREAAFTTRTVEILKEEIESKGRDRLKAVEMLWDRGWGKAEQSVDLTQHDQDRPTTEALIQTLTALRAELDTLRAGISVEGGK